MLCFTRFKATYLNGEASWIHLKRSGLREGWVDPQSMSGFSLRIWIRQHGCKENVSEAYYIDSGALHPHTWGYALYYKDDRLHVVVNTQKYEWRASFMWGFEQWVIFAMNWIPETGFKVWINGLHMGFFTDRTFRPGLFNRILPGNQDIYIGRANRLEDGTEAERLVPMSIYRFLIRDIVLPKPYLLDQFGKTYIHYLIYIHIIYIYTVSYFSVSQ